jgi:hypothetical protein
MSKDESVAIESRGAHLVARKQRKHDFLSSRNWGTDPGMVELLISRRRETHLFVM